MQKVLAREARAPLRAEITGLAPLVRALNQSSLDSLHKGELLALPDPVRDAAADLRQPGRRARPGDQRPARHAHRDRRCSGCIGERVDIDALALNLVTMVGLALGVDYALLVVSRFREELADGRERRRMPPRRRPRAPGGRCCSPAAR